MSDLLGLMNYSPSISSAGDSPVKTSPLQERVKVSQGADLDYFGNYSASFARWCPESSSWRTSQLSVSGEPERYVGRWPTSGMISGGVAYPQPRWAHLIDVSGGSALGGWPTPSKWCGKDILLTLTVAGWMFRAIDYRRRKVAGTPNIQWVLPVAVRMNMTGAEAFKSVDPLSGTEPTRPAPEDFYSDGGEQLNPDWVEALMGFPPGWTSTTGQPLRDHSTTGSPPGCASLPPADSRKTHASEPSETPSFPSVLPSSDDGSGPIWAPCVCGEFWCREHDQHAHDCPCPPIEDWASDPYS